MCETTLFWTPSGNVRWIIYSESWSFFYMLLWAVFIGFKVKHVPVTASEADEDHPRAADGGKTE